MSNPFSSLTDLQLAILPEVKREVRDIVAATGKEIRSARRKRHLKKSDPRVQSLFEKARKLDEAKIKAFEDYRARMDAISKELNETIRRLNELGWTLNAFVLSSPRPPSLQRCKPLHILPDVFLSQEDAILFSEELEDLPGYITEEEREIIEAALRDIASLVDYLRRRSVRISLADTDILKAALDGLKREREKIELAHKAKRGLTKDGKKISEKVEKARGARRKTDTKEKKEE